MIQWQEQSPTSQTNGTEQNQAEVTLSSAPAQETIDEARLDWSKCCCRDQNG